MKEFSDETKNKRRIAILNVILKRYSFIVWVPALFALLNFIGAKGIEIGRILSPTFIEYSGGLFNYYFTNIVMGFTFCLAVITFIMLITLIIQSLIDYISKGTIVKDFIEIIQLFFEALILIFTFIIKLPKKILIRLKDEKRRFNNALDKEMKKK